LSRNILVVESDAVIRSNICNWLVAHGYRVADAAIAADAQTILKSFRPDAAIVEIRSHHASEFHLLHRIKTPDWTIPVVVLVGSGSEELGTRATREGAEHYFVKPIGLQALQTELGRLLGRHRSHCCPSPTASKEKREQIDPFVGKSAAIRHLREIAMRVVQSSSPILLQGETGSGKGVLANWLHRNGPRAEGPFLDLNCAGLSRDLLESELFGHAKGAFTSAISVKPGLLEVADRGTVFLDEVGDLDPHVQPKLLKVLEDRVFRRVGDIRDRAVDIRLVSATHRELKELVRQGSFREDLYYRMNTVAIRVPALRERTEDIPLLVEALAKKLAVSHGGGELVVEDRAMKDLQRRAWPGNIRELHNVLERAVLLAGNHHLRIEDLGVEEGGPRGEHGDAGSGGTLKDMERAYIHHVLHDEQGSIERSAKRLGIPRSSLYNKMKRFEIPPGTGRIQP
jgi:DNA-binding NtrC family response regulator